jgi:hypothetical protein
MEVTDDVVRMPLALIRRMETQRRNTFRKHSCGHQTSQGKSNLPVAEAVMEEPDGIIRPVLSRR